MRDEVYSDMKISMMEEPTNLSGDDQIPDTPSTENVKINDNNNNYVVDYSKYLGVLEII